MTGRIAQFDQWHERGEIAPDAGGPNIFFWASEIIAGCEIGTRVQYQERAGDREPVAFSVRIA